MEIYSKELSIHSQVARVARTLMTRMKTLIRRSELKNRTTSTGLQS